MGSWVTCAGEHAGGQVLASPPQAAWACAGYRGADGSRHTTQSRRGVSTWSNRIEQRDFKVSAPRQYFTVISRGNSPAGIKKPDQGSK